MTTFQEKTGAQNPLDAVRTDARGSAKPSFADLDKDGDLDAIIGDWNGTLQYWQNNGGVFTQQTGAANPFNGIDVGNNAAPAFADIDKDGDLDAFIGSRLGSIEYFQNTNGSFTQQTGTANPFNGISVEESTPSFADIDKDGDLDAFVGSKSGAIEYFQNTNGSFTQQTGTANPFNGVFVGFNSVPSFADLDRDGDLDAFIGVGSGAIENFQNTNGSFTQILNRHLRKSPNALYRYFWNL
ncbi:hypothetical protein PCC9214_00437 [Planktothrix tepida]|uniref:FG-GAP repeat protein n=1 Tax=Planktothrix tepida PCC 9214 TaxID=671072 RepID=A0A1J1LGM4_9CYAN|nr:VCBS repeat-containing protein [Planktothrix tepida]CAD5917436.1 hypothetical protein PCC9214_00437 [Planktothrix tepida]CUR30729.1 hypothetical protein PL9214290320 [Planktothrix tepida PCC 9214]